MVSPVMRKLAGALTDHAISGPPPLQVEPPLPTLSPIIVTPWPAPWRVIPFVIVRVDDQFVWEQAGIVTVSPPTAELMAVCTSLIEHEAAV